MTNESLSSAAVDFELIFNLMPGSFVILKPNAPDYTILAISDEMLQFTAWERQQVVGKSIFAVFPDNPEALTATGLSFLRSSLQHAIQQKKANKMPVTRSGSLPGTGLLKEHYRLASTKPVLDKAEKVIYLIHTIAEVTKQVLTQNKIAETESRFGHIVQQAPVAIALTRGQDVIIENINAPMLRIMGQDREEDVLGKRLVEVLPELKDQPILTILLQVLNTGEPFQGNEVPVSFKMGETQEERYFDISYTPLIEAGEITGVLHVAKDVTEKVWARQKIEESEQQVRSFVQSAPMPIAVHVGKEMQIQFANQAMLDAWGKGNDVIGKLFVEVMPELSSQDIFTKIDRVFTTGIPYHDKNQEFIVEINSEWQTFYYNYSFTPLHNADGTIYGVMNTAADVTDLALAHQKIKAYAAEISESEERFRIMADAAPTLVWALNPDASVKYVNKTFLDFFGVSIEKLISDTWAPYIHPADQEITGQSLTDAIRNRRIYSMEQRLLRYDGTYRWCLSQGAPSYYPNGELYGYVGSAIDITNLKEAEAALELKNAQLSRTNSDLDNFVYTASHDLRSPITNIEGLANLLKEELTELNFTTARTEEVLQRMGASINRFKHTIKDLTEVSRLQQDLGLNATDELINIPDLYQEVVADLDYSTAFSSCSVQTNFQVRQLPFSRKNFRSILYNLLSNALKFQSPGRDSFIQVTTQAEESFVVLSVKDNGLGMNKRQQEQLYTMFKRFHDHVEGTGIGLYMVKRIVENAEGKIEVESQEGAGTEFKVYFKA